MPIWYAYNVAVKFRTEKPPYFNLMIYAHPSIECLGAAPAGFFRKIIEKYWIDGELPPTSRYALAASIHADWKTFKKYEKPLIEALHIMLPVISKERDKAVETTMKQKQHAKHMRDCKRPLNKPKVNKLFDSAESHENFTAVTPPLKKYHSGQTDNTAQKAAISKLNSPDRPLLTD